MTETFEIYFRDLTPDAQEQYLECAGCLNSYELNADICPIAILEVGD